LAQARLRFIESTADHAFWSAAAKLAKIGA
jgi:hypothetical protein